MNKWWLAFWLMFSSHLFAAEDIAQSSDLESIKRFPHSYIVQFKATDNTEYRFVLGHLENINGDISPEKEQRISGALKQVTYRLSNGHNPQKAFAFIEQQLINQGADVLYRCDGRACGSSSEWANTIFNYSRLYGIDDTQSIGSYQVGGTAYMLYAVQRGNRRVYLRLERLNTSQGSQAALRPNVSGNIQVQSSSSFNVKQPQVLFNDGTVPEQVIAFYKANSTQTLWVVAFDDEVGSYAQKLSRSMKQLDEYQATVSQVLGDTPNIKFVAVGGFSAFKKVVPISIQEPVSQSGVLIYQE